MPTVLIIDDNPAVGTALDVLFSLREITSRIALTPERGLEILASEPIDLVVQDMNFRADTTSGEEGVALFREIRAARPDLPIILLTAWTHLETAIELVKSGAADYLAKPWNDRKLLASVETLLELSAATDAVGRIERARRDARRALAAKYDLGGIVYASDAMQRVLELACQVARAEVPVLITGPNGSGKERIAAVIQANSSVKSGPFVAVNCGALPSELIEAELFGVEPGAYTGAGKAREGRFEAADGGTLFLDEIGNLPLAGQIKLLRVLETGQFERLGSNKTRTVKVRLISATNADLAQMIRAGSFREDLYYRLNVIQVALPALAERREDLLPIAEHFLGGRARLSQEAIAALTAHAWPGNVRELRNTLQRAELLCRDGVIGVADLGLPAAVRAAPALPPASLDEPDRETIEAALARANGTVSQAAAELGMSRQALYRRMERFGIKV
jgi:DNA-binding NtrC family response regulator